MAQFCDNFWGEENNGFNILLARMRFGRRTTEALIDYFSARLAIEEEYGRRMAKLSKLNFPAEETILREALKRSGLKGVGGSVDSFDATTISHPSELSGALQALTIQTAEEAERRAVYCEHLRQQIIWPLEKHLKEHQQSKDQNKEEMNRINRAKQSQYDLVGKYRERYYTRCKETAVISDTIAMGPATLANAIGSNHTVAGEPEQRKLKKAREAEAAADADFKQHMYRLIEINSQWVQRMSASAREFQVIELARLQLSQQVLTEHTEGLLRLNSTNCIGMERLRERTLVCDPECELEGFVRKYKTGTKIPDPPAYTSFYGIDSQMRRMNLENTAAVNDPDRQATLYTSTNKTTRTPWAREFARPISPVSWDEGGGGGASSSTSMSGGYSAVTGVGVPGSPSVVMQRSESVFSTAPLASLSQRSSAGSGEYRRQRNRSPSASSSHSQTQSNRLSSEPQSSYSMPVTAPSSTGPVQVSLRKPTSSTWGRPSSTTGSHSSTRTTGRSVRSSRSPPPPHLFTVRAAFPYRAQNEDEVSFGEGQLIYVTSTEDDPWWFGCLEGDGAMGLFPSNYVQR